jgi:hypothetical protein
MNSGLLSRLTTALALMADLGSRTGRRIRTEQIIRGALFRSEMILIHRLEPRDRLTTFAHGRFYSNLGFRADGRPSGSLFFDNTSRRMLIK